MDKFWLESLQNKFGLSGVPVYFEAYGNGHINRTFLLKLERGGQETKYIVQRINDKIFCDVELLMSNIAAVIDCMDRTTDEPHLCYVPTTDGKSYWYDGDGYYRVYVFIENSVAYDVVDSAEHFAAAARTFARFQNALQSFEVDVLKPVIPDFHNTAKRLNDFRSALEKNTSGRASDCLAETEFVLSRASYADKIMNALSSGALPLRVTHNDTKLNNVLIDLDTGEGIVIDLDTVMPGALCFDFGDAIRSGASSAAEDERDLDKVYFRIELFQAFAEAFLSVARGVSSAERESLAFGAILMTYECGMRFLADYLNGDTYFKTKYADHNLVRARTQFKLVADMEKCFGKMNEIVHNA